MAGDDFWLSEGGIGERDFLGLGPEGRVLGMAKGFEHPRWRIVRSLGEGGQGYTFLGEDATSPSSELVVIKRFKNESRAERFEREVTALRALAHPNIVEIIDHAAVNATESLFLVMKYAAGGDLASRPKLYEALPDATLGVAEKLAHALAYAHERGIIHRDIKPGNILFTSPGSHDCLVADFGICFVEDMPRVTAESDWMGPRAYIAPELEGGGEPTPASDVYSLGKVIYFMLSGGIDLPREDHRTAKYDLFGKGPMLRAIGMLLDGMLCPVEGRIPAMGEVARRIGTLRTMNLDAPPVALPTASLDAIGAAATRDRERLDLELSNQQMVQERLRRVGEVITDALEVVKRTACRAAELSNATYGDIFTVSVDDVAWTPAKDRNGAWSPTYKTLGAQGSRTHFVVDAAIRVRVERKAGVFKSHTLVLSLCHEHRAVVVVYGGSSPPREEPAGSIGVIPVYDGGPNRIGFLAARDRIPPSYNSQIGRSRFNQRFFHDNRQVAHYCKTTGWPENVEPLKQMVGEAIGLFLELAVTDPPWPMGTTQN